MIGQILSNIVLGSDPIKDVLATYSDTDGNTRYAFTPNVIPQGVPTPAASYKVLSIDSADTKDGFSGIDKYRVQADIFSTDYAIVNKLDGLIRQALTAGQGIYTVTDFDDTQIQVDVGVSRHDETEEIYFEEAETYARSTEYFIIINRQ